MLCYFYCAKRCCAKLVPSLKWQVVNFFPLQAAPIQGLSILDKTDRHVEIKLTGYLWLFDIQLSKQGGTTHILFLGYYVYRSGPMKVHAHLLILLGEFTI